MISTADTNGPLASPASLPKPPRHHHQFMKPPAFFEALPFCLSHSFPLTASKLLLSILRNGGTRHLDTRIASDDRMPANILRKERISDQTRANDTSQQQLAKEKADTLIIIVDNTDAFNAATTDVVAGYKSETLRH